MKALELGSSPAIGNLVYSNELDLPRRNKTLLKQEHKESQGKVWH